MKTTIKTATISMAIALFAAPAAQAQQGPSFEESIGFLSSYLVAGYEMRATGGSKVETTVTNLDNTKQYMRFELAELSPHYAVVSPNDGGDGAIRLTCTRSNCISHKGPNGSERNASDLTIYTRPETLELAKKALDHIFSILSPADPFAN